MTCKACENLSIDSLYQRAQTTEEHWKLHSSFDLLKTAANNGCSTCRVFVKTFNDDFANFDDKLFALEQRRGLGSPIVVFLEVFLTKGRRKSITKLHVQIGDEPDRPGTEPLRISFRVCKRRDFEPERENTEYTLRYTKIDHDLSSDENFRVAQDWVRECCTNHNPDMCFPPVEVELPTRLIDVGTGPNFEFLRLIETSEDEKGQYLSLSHCWGPPESKKLLTTTETLNSRLEFINIDEMPPNFSDAVIITRKLGYRFLWIDSLCIIQDSKLDWEAESENMGRIYTNAALTIAAAAATSSDGGLLKKSYQPIPDDQLHPAKWFFEDSIGRTHLFFQPDEKANTPLKSAEAESSSGVCHMKLSPDDEEGSIILEALTQFSGMEENWFRATSGGPLSHRGWCLQERLLSRRILYYGNRQIYWQCVSSRKAADGEDVPASAARSQANISNEVSEWPDVLGLKELHRKTFSTGSLDQRQAVVAKIYQTWHNILFMYINRRLTYESDRLPGLAGIATLIHELTGDQYVAGFWRENLLVDLIWSQTIRSLKEDAPRSIADTYEVKKPDWEEKTSKLSGPSWSWCSHKFLNDRLEFFADLNQEYQSRFWQAHDAEVVDVKVELVSDKAFGQVLSGELVIRGFTYPRWDVRALEETAFQQIWGVWSSTLLAICPHSPWIRTRCDNPSLDQNTLWDYWPRQALSPSKRVWIHIFWWLVDLCRIVLWHGMAEFYRRRDQADCGACSQYLCIHVLSIVEKTPERDGRHEVRLWSLVLEPVAGESEKYRRVGVARKAAYVSEQDFLDGTASEVESKIAPRAFDGWQFREVVII